MQPSFITNIYLLQTLHYNVIQLGCITLGCITLQPSFITNIALQTFFVLKVAVIA